MRGRLRNQSRLQSQRTLEFRQKAWRGGENSDLPASEIAQDEVALLENAVAFPEYVEGRSGSRKFSDTALPGSGTLYSLHQHKGTKKWVLHRGTGVHVAAADMASWTDVSDYASGSQGVTEAGDASNQISDTFFFGASASNTNDGVLYWNLTDSAGTRTVNVYKDSAKTQLVATGSRLGDGGIFLRPQNASGLFGTTGVTYSTDDVDISNTFTVAIGGSIGYLVSDHESTIRDFDDGVVIASDVSQIPNFITFINLSDNLAYPLNPYGPVYAITGSGSQGSGTPYGYRYLYTFCRITDTDGAGDTTKSRIDGVLVHETGSTRPSPTGNETPIDYGEFWLADEISDSDPHTLTFNNYSDIIDAGLSMSGHFTHIGLYRTLDIGSGGVDPVTGAGNNTEIYVWVGDFPMGSGDVEDTKSDEYLRAAFAKGFGLKSRFFEPLQSGDVLEIEPNFMLCARRGESKIPYCQIAGDYKVHAGHHRRDVQFMKVDGGVQSLQKSPDLLTILCGNKTYISSPNSYFNAGDIESVFVRNHLSEASDNIGVTDYSSICQKEAGVFIAHCSDHTIREWNGSAWGRDLCSRKVSKLIRKILTGSVMGYFDGSLLLWYRIATGDNTTLCLRFGFGRDAGFGWSRVTGDDWVFPPASIGAVLIQDANAVQRLLVLDGADGAFYWVETFDGYTGSGLAKTFLDKVAVNGTGGTAIPGKVRLREYVGEKESYELTHEETHGYVRAVPAAGFPSGFEINMLGYVDGATTASETVENLNQKGDWQFWTSVTGKRIQIELNFLTSGWRLTRVESRVKSQDRASIALGPSSTTEGSLQEVIASGLKHWMTRPNYSTARLKNRANGLDYTLTAAISFASDPSGKSYAAVLATTNQGIYQVDTNSYGDFTIAFFVKDWADLAQIIMLLSSDVGDAFYVVKESSTQISVNSVNLFSVSSDSGTWRHYAFVRSGSAVSVYQDGAFVGSMTFAPATGGVSTYSFGVSKIFDLRVYNKSLSAEAVAYLYGDIWNNSGAKVLPSV